MSAVAVAPKKPLSISSHAVAVSALASLLFGYFLYGCVVGWRYYLMPLEDRPMHPLHRELRPSGSIGLTFGIFSTLLFAIIYLYPLRKRWAWMRKIGMTRHWGVRRRCRRRLIRSWPRYP